MKGVLLAQGSSDEGQKFIRHNLVTEYVKRRISNFDKKNMGKQYSLRFSNIPSIKCNYNIDSQSLPVPTEQEMEDAYEKLGKGNKWTSYRLSCMWIMELAKKGISRSYCSRNCNRKDMCFTHTQSGKSYFPRPVTIQQQKNLFQLKKKITHLKDNL